MSTIETLTKLWEFNRGRTLALLDTIAEEDDPAAVLAWRPGPGRAHIGWQLMHVGITEELFATERFLQTIPDYADFVPRFRGGSTPDDKVPPLETIREVLNHSREHLLATAGKLKEADLESSNTEFLQERGWTVGTALNIIAWHEAHHHGQAHITLNLWKAARGD